MAMNIDDVREWIEDAKEDGAVAVAIDDDGACLIALDAAGHETGAYLEVGFQPEPITPEPHSPAAENA